jgi:hypothetical protein
MQEQQQHQVINKTGMLQLQPMNLQAAPAFDPRKPCILQH